MAQAHQVQLHQAEVQHKVQLSFLQGENKAMRDARSTDAASASRLSAADPDKDFETYRIAHDPPDAEKQAAMHTAAAAKVVHSVSQDEQRLLLQAPADTASDDEKHLFQLELLRVRRENPPPKLLAFAGKTVLTRSQISPDIFPPAGMSSWQQYMQPRLWNFATGLTNAERARLVGQPSSVQIGGPSGFSVQSSSGSSKRPDQISKSVQYRTCADRLVKFALATRRWSRTEAELHRRHVDFVLDLFEEGFVPEEIMNYDDEVRYSNHLRDVHDWGVHKDLLAKWLKTTPSTPTLSAQQNDGSSKELAQLLNQVSQLAKAVKSGGGKKPKAGGETETKKQKAKKAFLARPCCRVKQDSSGKNVCRVWNFGNGRCTFAQVF